MKTIEINANIGVCPGYGHDNQGGAPELFTKTLQDICKEVFDETGTYCSFVVTSAKTIYHTEWGCPVGGEKTFNVSTLCNPIYMPYLEKFRMIAHIILKRLKVELKQSTISVVEKEVDFEYWEV